MKNYIVFVNYPQNEAVIKPSELSTWHKSFLPATLSDSDKEQRLIHSYRHVISGFAAKLTPEELKDMEAKEGFVSAQVEKIYSLHTTHTPTFLGLNQNNGYWNQSSYGKGVIIGLLDTGITPNHPSYSDAGVPSPPAKWKGKCEFNATTGGCNNKLIGARDFTDESGGWPGDDEGHGTHTSSTAAGNFVSGADVFGQANGTAVGMAPLAHVAMYKVCDDFGCSGTAILAAMDAAIDDGVDILSLSLGGGSEDFFSDPIALGAFSAVQKGIVVSCSAGNEGPLYQTLSNEAPWILTVGASTVDRTFLATAKLGNGGSYDGESIFQISGYPSSQLPLVYAGANGNQDSAFCAPESLRNSSVQGKIVLCERGGGIGRIDKGQEVKDAGGVAMILMNDEINGYSTLADPHVLPATHVSYAAGVNIKTYINSTSSPTAAIVFKGTVIGKKIAPEVTSFSSRGPSLASPGILKPDIIGPGVNILAAWPISVENKTNSDKTFNVISGTSMSCPHLSGIAALLKSSHPDWSPAAIKSAIMTSADIVNLEGKSIVDQTLLTADVFAIGAGHVNPSKANNPGLIYDLQPDDYIPYLCGLNYTDRQVGIIVQHPVNCSDVKTIPEAQLNYPSFSVVMEASETTTLEYTRVVTYVGQGNASYSSQVVAPTGVDVTVKPDQLVFSEANQKATYSVSFTPSKSGNTGNLSFSEGYLSWVSAQRVIRSPVVVIFN